MGDAARRAAALPGASGQPVARPAILRPAAARSRRAFSVRAIPTVPAHVGTMLGLSVAGYGVALALVTGIQATSEAAIQANRAPLGAAIDELGIGHDRLERELAGAARAYAGAASGYDAAKAGLTGLDERLATLSDSVAQVDGAARALPATVSLPPVVRSVRTTSTRTVTHATSGGSAAP